MQRQQKTEPGKADVLRAQEQLNRIERACLDKGLRMTEQRRVIARVHHVVNAKPQVAAQLACRMVAPKVFGGETARLHQRDGQRMP